MKKIQTALATTEIIANKIYFFRDKKVMMDADRAARYGVETRELNQAVRRNIDFPKDSMFELGAEKFGYLKSQSVTSSWGGRRKLPLASSEQGVAMMSCIER